MSHKVSILIPTYKRAGYLKAAIRSALMQTCEDVEILVLDDASPDETPNVAAAFLHDRRMRYIRHAKNLGIVGNWQAGIEAATGDFFCLLHDDDTFEPTFIQALLKPLLADESLILAFCDHWLCDTAGNRLIRETDEATHRFLRDRMVQGHQQDFVRAALIDSSIPIGAALFRKTAVQADFLDERAKGSIDAWLLYKCVKSGGGAYYLSDRLMNYRIHPGNMSGAMTMYMAEGHLFRYRAILSDPEMAPIHTEIRHRMATILTSYGIDLISSGELRRAQEPLREALRIQTSLRGMVALGLAYSGSVGGRVTTMLRGGR